VAVPDAKEHVKHDVSPLHQLYAEPDVGMYVAEAVTNDIDACNVALLLAVIVFAAVVPDNSLSRQYCVGSDDETMSEYSDILQVDRHQEEPEVFGSVCRSTRNLTVVIR
jgi:hypothetical protein